MRNNREFVEYFGLDLITAAARADADRGWSLAARAQRQPLLAPTARAVCVLDKAVVEACALEGLDRHSHVWLLFAFHENTNGRKRAVRAKVRPPRAAGGRSSWPPTLREEMAPNDLGADGRTVQSSAPGPEPAAVFELGAGDALFIPPLRGTA
ncbi:tRNA (adenine-N6-)-methyltransferase [Aureococcus anophagefferens]|uniref:tRNA (Adenine-N6-)-methyltransferase n=1 Tax=Aureococcus anophagefferens TaxID=44056 RepID=A0ABR1FQZ0_AURAN